MFVKGLYQAGTIWYSSQEDGLLFLGPLTVMVQSIFFRVDLLLEQLLGTYGTIGVIAL